MPDERSTHEVAVLVSGGVDSAVLCVELLSEYRRVHPLYVRFGLRWEEVELGHLRRFLAAVDRPGLEALTVLDEPVADVYGGHWSVEGPDVPGSETPDEAVYLPGRNLLFVAKAAVWCRMRAVERLALGTLGSNPFPDSTPAFYRDMESVSNRALDGRLRILRPLAHDAKGDVLRRAAELPLELTFSCLRPVDGEHCGRCNKCAERREGFRAAGVADPTTYASSLPSPA